MSSQECSTKDDKDGAILSVSLMSIVFIMYTFSFVFYLVNYKKMPKMTSVKPDINKTTAVVAGGGFGKTSFFERFEQWTKRAGGVVNTGMILAILAAGLVIGFNSYIMTPLVTTLFPYKQIKDPVELPGYKNSYPNYMYPGHFFIALVGFFLSSFLLFFVLEVFNKFSDYIDLRNSLIIIFLLLLGFFIWNVISAEEILSKKECVENQVLGQFAMNMPKKEEPIPPTFGVF